MKKIKLVLYSLVVVILLAVIASYIAYSSYWAKDPAIKPDPSLLSYYHETYDDCREAFLMHSGTLNKSFDSIRTGSIKVPCKTDDDLTVDWFYIPPKAGHDKLLILNSGLHGIEGYTGSAVQSMFIEKILPGELKENMGVLMIHAVNPYGFKYHRKVTGNNVDLNRNCVPEGESFDIKNAGYSQLTGLLMPSEPVNFYNMRNRFFYLTAIYKIIQESMPVLRQAALQGQYDHEKGIYYGDKQYEPQIDSLRPLFKEIIGEYRTVLNVDLHTGYGARGKMHLFIDKPEDKEVLAGLEKVFAGSEIDWGSSDDFYTITGEYTVWVNDLVPGTLCIPMVFEFGTLDSQKTFGSLKSMQVMILENQGAHYGYKDSKNEARVKEMFDEMYYPSSEVWRSKVISDSYETMSRMMRNFGEM